MIQYICIKVRYIPGPDFKYLATMEHDGTHSNKTKTSTGSDALRPHTSATANRFDSGTAVRCAAPLSGPASTGRPRTSWRPAVPVPRGADRLGRRRSRRGGGTRRAAFVRGCVRWRTWPLTLVGGRYVCVYKVDVAWNRGELRLEVSEKTKTSGGPQEFGRWRWRWKLGLLWLGIYPQLIGTNTDSDQEFGVNLLNGIL